MKGDGVTTIVQESTESITQEAQHTLHVLDQTGDTRTTWDPEVEEEVDAARLVFAGLKAKGYLAYSVDPSDGSKGEVIREFDPAAQAIIMSPQMQGG
jgi:hypothetical protein